MLFNTNQVKSGRCQYITSGTWSLEDQVRMSEAFGFCRALKGNRLCGGNVPQGRGKCKKCPDVSGEPPPLDGIVDYEQLSVCFRKPHQKEAECQAKFAPMRAETNNVACQTEPQVVEFSNATHRYTITIEPLGGHSVVEHVTLPLWEELCNLYRPPSMGNGKSLFKKSCKILGIDHLTCKRIDYATKMLELGPQGWFDETNRHKQTVHLRNSSAKLMVYCGCQQFRDAVHVLRLPNLQALNRLEAKPLTKERLDAILALLQKYESADIPQLLSRLREKTYDFHPEDVEGRRWKFQELLAWHWPAIRGSSATFVFRTCPLPDVKKSSTKTDENSIHVVNGEFVGMHFGLMKGFHNNAKMRLIKQFNLGPDGCTSFQNSGFIHLSESEYKAFWACMDALMREIIETTVVVPGGWIFDVSKSERKSQQKLFKSHSEYHGATLKTQMQRIVFRNGYPEDESDAFYTVTMGHSGETDLKDYYKPELTADALAKLLPRRNED